MKRFFLLLVATTVLVATGTGYLLFCNHSSIPVDEFTRWMGDSRNGISKDKYVNGLHICLKYLPTDYLVYSDLKKSFHMNKQFIPTAAITDSLKQLYALSMTFVLSIGPDERDTVGADIMMRDVTSYPDFVNRAIALNFEMEKFISLRSGAHIYPPVLTNLENTYGLSTARNIVLVFPRPNRHNSAEKEEYEVVWNDMLYTTGIHHFIFSAHDIESIPSLSFEKIL
jgi:hypothetical protein